MLCTYVFDVPLSLRLSTSYPPCENNLKYIFILFKYNGNICKWSVVSIIKENKVLVTLLTRKMQIGD